MGEFWFWELSKVAWNLQSWIKYKAIKMKKTICIEFFYKLNFRTLNRKQKGYNRIIINHSLKYDLNKNNIELITIGKFNFCQLWIIETQR